MIVPLGRKNVAMLPIDYFTLSSLVSLPWTFSGSAMVSRVVAIAETKPCFASVNMSYKCVQLLK